MAIVNIDRIVDNTSPAVGMGTALASISRASSGIEAIIFQISEKIVD
jgi:hypothetical protein